MGCFQSKNQRKQEHTSPLILSVDIVQSAISDWFQVNTEFTQLLPTLQKILLIDLVVTSEAIFDITIYLLGNPQTTLDFPNWHDVLRQMIFFLQEKYQETHLFALLNTLVLLVEIQEHHVFASVYNTIRILILDLLAEYASQDEKLQTKFRMWNHPESFLRTRIFDHGLTTKDFSIAPQKRISSSPKSLSSLFSAGQQLEIFPASKVVMEFKKYSPSSTPGLSRSSSWTADSLVSHFPPQETISFSERLQQVIEQL